jgi:hypothetical protein
MEIEEQLEDAWLRGKREDEYQIYLDCTDDNPPKSFDEWLNS